MQQSKHITKYVRNRLKSHFAVKAITKTMLKLWFTVTANTEVI